MAINWVINTAAIFFYGTATGVQISQTNNSVKLRRIYYLAAVIAVTLHGIFLHHAIDVANGQNLSPYNIVSLVLWLGSILIIVSSLRLPIDNLSIFLFPLTMVSILLIMFIPSQHIVNTSAHPKHLTHILSAVLAISLLGVAVLQAIVLAIQDNRLRKQPSRISRFLPPLETMEKLLFQMIWLGFILLSIVNLSAILLFKNIFIPPWREKTILAFSAWIIYALLILGRHLCGWRGRTAIYGTLGGFTFLILSYLSSKLLFAVMN